MIEPLDEPNIDIPKKKITRLVLRSYLLYIGPPLIVFGGITLISLYFFKPSFLEFTELGIVVCAIFQVFFSLLALFIFIHLRYCGEHRVRIRVWTFWLPLLVPVFTFLATFGDVLHRNINRIDIIFIVTALFSIINAVIQFILFRNRIQTYNSKLNN